MSIKKILVHLAADASHLERMKVAMELARRNDAHVEAIFFVKPVGMPGEITGRGASAAYIGATVREARRRAEELEKEFVDTCKRDKLSYEWSVEEGDPAEVIEEHVHLADLAVVTQVKPDYIDEVFYPPIPDKITTRAGCPVLVLPEDWTYSEFGKNVLVAWKSSREATRALRESLPILHTAEKVTILTIGPKSTHSLPIKEAQEYLSRHGIDAETRIDFHDKSHFGEIMLSHAQELGADLLVMGAYGQSRLKEMLTGGTTRHVMGHMTLPVLMSH
ncbi:MAG: universal stress protein [Alphaproteobacteria bacterium]|nr:universal stress protein [Alphaproteobacteria bacterium]